MFSQDMSPEKVERFLQAKALEYGFNGDITKVFTLRFNPKYEAQERSILIEKIWTNELNREQNFQDKITKILEKLEAEGCPKRERKQGRSRKGEEPWRKAYQWLWETAYPEWEKQQKKDTINWRDVLRREQKLTTNPLFQHQEAQQNRDDVYVNLALVKRTKREKPLDVKASSEGSHLYEPLETEKTYQHEQFLREIIEKGEGNSRGKRIALIGEPGAGKTTLLTRIGNWLLDQDLGLPIWISVGELAKNGELSKLEDYLVEKLSGQIALSEEKKEAVKKDVENTINANIEKIWLLLDGVDEIASSSQILEYIDCQLKRWSGQCRVILTCRFNLWASGRNPLSEFETYRLLDYDYPQQVHEFIDNFFSSNTSLKKVGGDAETQEEIKPPLIRGVWGDITLIMGIWGDITLIQQDGEDLTPIQGIGKICLTAFLTPNGNRSFYSV